MKKRLDLELTVYLDGATHVVITCVSIKGCGHRGAALTSDLIRKLPRARTVRDFQEKMLCTRCRSRGWCTIEPARRG